MAPVGALAVTTTEAPSATLDVKVAAGAYLNQDGTIGSFAGITTRAMTVSATNYLYLDLTSAGALTVNTTGFRRRLTFDWPSSSRGRPRLRASPMFGWHFQCLVHLPTAST